MLEQRPRSADLAPGMGRAARAVLLAGTRHPCLWGHWARGAAPSPAAPAAAALCELSELHWRNLMSLSVPVQGAGTGWAAGGPFQPKPLNDSVVSVRGCTRRPPNQRHQQCLLAFPLPVPQSPSVTQTQLGATLVRARVLPAAAAP